MTATEQVVLVDENDNPVGTAEKLEAHQNNMRHRAFSVFVLQLGTPLGVLLQQRAKNKYHSPLLWTNTCCSHPRPGENIVKAGERRLFEEMGIKIPLKSIGFFHYIAHFDNGLSENEVDHVLIGFLESGDTLHPNSLEVESYRWVDISNIKLELQAFPERFTPWFSQALDLVLVHLENHQRGYAI